MLIYHDPMPLYSPRGVDVLPAMLSQFEKEHRCFSWDLSFYTQQAKTSRNDLGTKVFLGNRLGRINAVGLFFNTDLKFTAADDKQYDLLFDPASGDNFIQEAKDKFPALTSAYNTLKAIDDAVLVDPDKVNISLYDDTQNTRGFMSLSSRFKKRGIRNSFGFEPIEYFRFKLQFGFAEYSSVGDFISEGVSTENGVTELNTHLTNQQSITLIASNFGYDFNFQKKTTVEDVCFSAEFKYPVIFHGADSEPSVSLHPFFGLGVWIPSGAKSDPSKIFSLSSGNEGFLGLGINGGLIFHFLEVYYVSFEGACTFFESKDVILRYPTHSFQQGLYPFTKWFNKRPGMSWDLNVSLCARHVFEGLSFYLDYIYAQHECDTIASYIPLPDFSRPDDVKSLDCTTYLTSNEYTPLKVAPAEGAALTEQDVFDALSLLGFWKSEMFTVGMSYEITPGFELGLAFRGNLSGRQITRTETLMGTIRLAF